jgi:hypothetical protein
VNAASAGDSLVVILFADYQLLDTDALTFTGGTTIEGDLTVDTNTLYVDSTNNNVGIGTSSPSSYNANIDDLVVSNAASGGITIATGTTSQGAVAFADGTSGSSPVMGRIRYDHSVNEMDFRVNNSEAMRIDSSGNLLVNTTSTSPNPGVALQPIGNVGIGNSNGNSGASFLEFRRNTTQIGGVTQSGTTGVSYNTSSDHRLKENVTDVTDGITRVKQLEPKRFNFIADPDRTVDGFLAHQAQAVVPEAVTGTHNEVDDDGNAVMQGIDQSKLVPLLTAALKEAICQAISAQYPHHRQR